MSQTGTHLHPLAQGQIRQPDTTYSSGRRKVRSKTSRPLNLAQEGSGHFTVEFTLHLRRRGAWQCKLLPTATQKVNKHLEPKLRRHACRSMTDMNG